MVTRPPGHDGEVHAHVGETPVSGLTHDRHPINHLARLNPSPLDSSQARRQYNDTLARFRIFKPFPCTTAQQKVWTDGRRRKGEEPTAQLPAQ